MPDRINSRAKGRAFERAIARDLRAWLGDGWTVTRAQTDRQRGQAKDGHAGEFVVEGPHSFPWAVECKAAVAFDARHVWNNSGPLAGWWAQAVRQARAVGREPLLVVKVARGDTLAVLRPGLHLPGPLLERAIGGDDVQIRRWDCLAPAVRRVGRGEVRA